MEQKIKSKNNARLDWIDLSKSIGIFFVLLSHSQVNIPLVSGLGNLFYIGIFFVIAGYTYHDEEVPVVWFAWKKAKRVLVPYLQYSMALFLIMSLKRILEGSFTKSETLTSLFGIFYARNQIARVGVPEKSLLDVMNAPLWFLPAFYLSFVLFHVLVRIGKEKLLLFTLISMIIGMSLHYLSPVLLPWSIDTAFLFEGMFAAGYFAKLLMSEKKQSFCFCQNLVKRADFQYLLVVGFFIGMLILQFYNGRMNLSIGDFGKTVYGGFFGVIFGAIFVMLLSKNIPWKIFAPFLQTGQNSMQIMAFHLLSFEICKVLMNPFLPEFWDQNTLTSKLIRVVIVIGTMIFITRVSVWIRNWKKGRVDQYERT